MAVGGDNFLIPANVRSTTRRDLDVGGIKLAEIIDILNESAPQAVHFIVFDACRNNLGGIRGAKGFVPVAEKPGMLIAFSTAPGATASDDGRDGAPYAEALAAELVEPGLNHSDMFFEVRTRVAASIAQEQIPWTQDGLMRRVHFGGEAAKPAEPAPTQARLSEAAEAWAAAKDTTHAAVLEAFIARYKDTFFAQLARARVDELKKRQTAVVAPKAPAPTPQAKPAMPAPPTPGHCDGVEARVGDEKRCLRPKDNFKDCRTCPEMVVVPAGEFTMGSLASERNLFGPTGSLSKAHEERHGVKIARPFAVGQFAVSRGEFTAFVENSRAHVGSGCSTLTASGWQYQKDASWRAPGFEQDDRHPVVCVSWEDAKEFAAYISAMTGKPYRLPTEAEREYVARAGTSTPFWWGSSISTAQANYQGDAVWRRKTVPVDAFRANPWGLYNVHGNVREWVEDCYQDSYRRVPSDGSAADIGDCSSRILRGGSWAYGPEDLRAASRDKNTATSRYSNYGFRLARSLAP